MEVVYDQIGAVGGVWVLVRVSSGPLFVLFLCRGSRMAGCEMVDLYEL